MAGMSLRIRGTFIHFNEEPADSMGKARLRRSRSSMLPSTQLVQEGSEVIDAERAYLADLSAKLRSLWGAGAAPRVHDARSFSEEESTAPKGSIVAKQLQAAPLLRGNTTIRLAASDMLFRMKSGEETETTEDLATCSPSSSTSTEGEPVSPFSLAELELNEGSLGHPEVCARPCLYFAAGHCDHGGACPFCHLPHSKRPVHLDKKHREMLQNVPSKKLATLLMPLLKEKLLSFDSSEESLQAFDRFVATCGLDSAVSATSQSRALRSGRSLIVSCRPMSFRLLLLTLMRSALKNDEAAKAEGSALLAQLIHRSTIASGAD